MYIDDPKKSFVINNFSAFYAEVVRQKERIADALTQARRSPNALKSTAPKEVILGPLDKTITEGVQIAEPTAPETQALEIPLDEAKNLAISISDTLYKTLKTQEIEATQLAGEFASAYYKEAQYVMAALADEVFLYFPWPGRDYWQDYLLEMRLFGTHVAGDSFYSSLDKLLDVRDSTNQEMGEVYLSALGLGFLGRYHTEGDKKILEEYRDRLYSFITHEQPKLFQGERALFPEAEKYLITDAHSKDLIEPRIWWIIYASTCFALLVASYGAWHHATSELATALESLDKAKMQSIGKNNPTGSVQPTGGNP